MLCCCFNYIFWWLFQTNYLNIYQTTHTHTRLTALCPGLPGWAGTRKIKPIWILLKQETESGSGIRWAICKSARRSRQITMPAPHHSVFYRPDALPAAQPTVSKHWRQIYQTNLHKISRTGRTLVVNERSEVINLQSLKGRCHGN